MDIKELALKVSKEMIWRMDEMTLETFAARLISAYLAEPVAWRTHHDEPMLFPTINEAWQYCEDDEGPEPLFAAPVKDSLTTEPEPSEFSAEQRDKDWSAIKSTDPSSEEVQRMIGWLRVELGHLVTCQQAADLIERLAARVPDGCVVVPREPTEAMCLAGQDHPGCYQVFKAMIAAGEVKP